MVKLRVWGLLEFILTSVIKNGNINTVGIDDKCLIENHLEILLTRILFKCVSRKSSPMSMLCNGLRATFKLIIRVCFVFCTCGKISNNFEYVCYFYCALYF